MLTCLKTLEEIAILFDGEDANVAGTNMALGTDGELKPVKGGDC
jgi:hypothetical protein